LDHVDNDQRAELLVGAHRLVPELGDRGLEDIEPERLKVDVGPSPGPSPVGFTPKGMTMKQIGRIVLSSFTAIPRSDGRSVFPTLDRAPILRG